jgi:hypothetical protein
MILLAFACTPTPVGTPATATPADTADTGTVELTPETSSVQGRAVKGPFLDEGTIRVFKLDDTGEPTTTRQFGRTNRNGRLLVPPLLFEGASELEVEGPTYDELAGADGTVVWALRAMVDVRDGRIVGDVNLLTHLHHARATQLLAASTPGDFDGARRTALAELAEVFVPIAHLPSELDLTGGTAPSLDRDNAQLLAWSVGVLAADVTPAEYDVLAADFGANGAVDADGVPILARIRAGATEVAYTTARDNLVGRYGDAPPQMLWTDVARYTTMGCVREGTGLEAVCEGSNDVTTPLPSETWTDFTFVPPEDGAWVIAANVGTFNLFHRWSMTDGSGNTVGSASMQTDNAGTTSALTAGEPYTLSVYNAGDTDTIAAIDVFPASTGTASRPATLMHDVDEEGWSTLANTAQGPPSVYRFDRAQLPVAQTTVSVTVSDITGDVQLEAFPATSTEDPQTVLDDPTRRTDVVSGAQGVTLSGLAIADLVYLRVQSLDNAGDPTSGRPGRVPYRIQVR